jgi:hypothetical protein
MNCLISQAARLGYFALGEFCEKMASVVETLSTGAAGDNAGPELFLVKRAWNLSIGASVTNAAVLHVGVAEGIA